jgi:deoxycytidine triphosphate deaminase
MVISISEILERGLIKNRDFGGGEGLVEPEGAAVDIRLGEIWEMDKKSKAFLYKKTRQTREYKKVAEYHPGKDEKYTLKPGKIYQFKSIEVIDVPEDLVARFVARYNLLASGILILGYKADPGFKGNFVCPVHNLSGQPYEIELGARWAQFEFHRIEGKSVKYRGQWREGRVFTKGEEVQV